MLYDEESTENTALKGIRTAIVDYTDNQMRLTKKKPPGPSA